MRKLKKGNESISKEFTTYVDLYNQMFDDKIIQKKPSFYDLFKNIKYHFINLHKLGVFKTFPSHDKIIYIGGIHVESKGILTKPKAAANEEKVKFESLFNIINLNKFVSLTYTTLISSRNKEMFE